MLDIKKGSSNVIFYLHCAIDRNEHNCVFQCESFKDIWRLLKITHEETNQVKESKINILMHGFEIFSMKDNESIIEMFTRFTDIINGLQVLGKNYKETETVMKILRFLPK